MACFGVGGLAELLLSPLARDLGANFWGLRGTGFSRCCCLDSWDEVKEKKLGGGGDMGVDRGVDNLEVVFEDLDWID